MANAKKTKCIVIGAGPVGALAALYAANRGWDVEVYELRGGDDVVFSRLHIVPIT
jgi:kynurenine 3-monooxygenase